MSNIRIITTGDDSHSLYLPELNEHYHSTHGAVQESQHVFIDAGLKQTVKNEVSILEIGFGTGLNALLSLVYAVNHNISIVYTSIEKYPLPGDFFKKLNYGSYLEQGNFQREFLLLHESPWNSSVSMHPNFELLKVDTDILDFDFHAKYDLVFFDAFAPAKQPEMWERNVFKPIVDAIEQDGIITTYAASGMVRRLWQELGLNVEKLPGPPGKREMLRGIKTSVQY